MPPEHGEVGGCTGLFRRFRDAEVEYVHVMTCRRTAAGEEQVRWFEVAMDEPHLMTGVYAIRGLCEDVGYLVRWQWPTFFYPLAEILADQVFHHQKFQVESLVAQKVMDGHHVGMVQARRDPSLPSESRPGGGACLSVLGDRHRLERDVSLEGSVHGEIDRSHASATKKRNYVVALADRLAEKEAIHGFRGYSGKRYSIAPENLARSCRMGKRRHAWRLVKFSTAIGRGRVAAGQRSGGTGRRS
ncbi:MAG TPA: hypothetical protein VF647_15120 [Longimicrobium sp.]